MIPIIKYAKDWTIIDSIQQHLKDFESATAFTFINEQGDVLEEMSFGLLYRQVLNLALELTHYKLYKEVAILMLPNNAHFIRAFLACIYVGCIAVPIPPPQGKRHFARFKAIIANSKAKVILTHTNIIEKMNESEHALLSQLGINIIAIDKFDIFSYSRCHVTRQYHEISFLQYTSGSTALPKGVVVTHRNILTNEQQMTEAFQHDKTSLVVGWLPFYHDMGLIGNILQPLFCGIHCVLFTPAAFLNSPKLWLQSISKYKATTSGGPNFAYQHCVNKIKKDEISDIDLTHWKTAFNGAEMIQPETLRLFAGHFANLGFRLNCFFPCYGMAEATLFVTGKYYSPIENVGSYVNCGKPYGDTQFFIVNPVTREQCQDETTGEVWLTGDSMAAGYWSDREMTKDYFKAQLADGTGPFLRTGDLGFCKNTHLYLTGRIKELFIIRGRNYSPYDIEVAIKSHVPQLAKARCVIFAVEENSEEKIIILIEAGKSDFERLLIKEIFCHTQMLLAQQFELDLHSTIFVRTNTLPRTTSGKLQYYECQRSYHEKKLLVLGMFTKDDLLNGNAMVPHNEDPIIHKLSMLIANVIGCRYEKIDDLKPLLHYGIDSLKAVTLIHLIEKEFKHDLSIEVILNGMTLQSLRDQIQPITDVKKPVEINNHDLTQPIPLTPQQQSIWLWQKLHPRSNAYHIPILLDVKGQYRCERVISTLASLADKHPILKAVFMQTNQVYQYSDPNFKLPILITDLTQYHSTEQAMLSTRVIQRESDNILNLEGIPAFRVHIIKLSENHCKLSIHFHHIIIDGWSINILVQDFIMLYQSSKMHLPHPKNYYDYAKQQAISDIQWHQAEKYWVNYIGQTPPIYMLTQYQNRQSPYLHEEQRYETFILDALKLKQLHTFNQAHQFTTTQTLLAIYHIILHKYSQENKTLIGYPSANRSDGCYADTVGCFVNTLVNKVDFTGDMTILDVIFQVKQGLLHATHHEDYPFHALVELFELEKVPHISPLFQCFFVMQNAVHSIPPFANIETVVLQQPSVSAMYDLVLEIQCLENTLLCKVEYNQTLPAKLITHFIQHYLFLVDVTLQKPNTTMAELILTDTVFESTTVNDKYFSSVVELFEREVKKCPDRIAIESVVFKWTYHQLNKKASILSAMLVKRGIKRGDHVLLSLARSPWMIAALIAIQKINAVYIPVDIHYPEEHLNRITALCQPKAIIYDETVLTILSSISIQISLQHLNETNESSYLWTNGHHDPNDTAYIITTSGTSGEIKGVSVAHSALLNLTLAAVPLFRLTDHDKVLQFSSLSWDTASEEIYPALTAGATVVLRSNEQVETYGNLLKLLTHYQITICNFPSSYWQAFHFYLRDRSYTLPGTLRLIIIGGEPVSSTILMEWFLRYGERITLLNTYGTTEATSISAACSLNDVIKQYSKLPLSLIPIGKPIAGCALHILDDQLCAVPPGVCGELFISGKGLSKGYVNDDEATQRKYIYLKIPNGKTVKAFATGDFAFYSFEKDVFLLGRRDQQVKRRGVRIQLTEIETLLLKCEWVMHVVMRVQKNKNDYDQNQIIAYLVLKNTGLTANVIHFTMEYLQRQLPRQYLPDRIEVIHTIPKLTNGKIDYNRLADCIIPLKELTITEDFSETEKKVSAIWRSILAIDHVNRNDNFFDAGGNSFSLIQLHEKLISDFEVPVEISELFTYSTFREQANYIDELQAKNLQKSLESIDKETLDA